MQEYVGVAFNHMLVVDPDTNATKPQAEMVVMTSSVQWDANISGVHTVRSMGDFRLSIGEEGLRQMAKFLVEQADILKRIGVEFGHKSDASKRK